MSVNSETTTVEYWWPEYDYVAVDIGKNLFHKREFYELKYGGVTYPADYITTSGKDIDVDTYTGIQTRMYPYQITPQRYMSPYTPFDAQLLIYETGTGKTATTLGVIENIQLVYPQRALIIVPNALIMNVWIDEIVKFNPQKYESTIPKEEKVRYKKDRDKKIAQTYEIVTRETFGPYIQTLSENEKLLMYSNRIIVFDEAHHFKVKTKEKNVEVETNVYKIYNDFIHSLNNIKTILLTATPMIDSEREIIRLANMILPLSEQIDEKSAKKMKFDRFRDLIRDKLAGKVSFVAQSITTTPKKIFGKTAPKYGIDEMKVYINSATSTVQTNAYKLALTKDKDKKLDDTDDTSVSAKKLAGLRPNSLEASKLVFPDGTWGKEGYNKNTERKTTAGGKEKIVLKPNVKSEFILENLHKYSATYASFIKLIMPAEKDLNPTVLETKTIKDVKDKPVQVNLYSANWPKVWAFSDSVSGSGLKSLELILENLGWERVTSYKPSIFNSVRRRFISAAGGISGDTLTSLSRLFNDPRNVGGHYIQLFLGSKALTEGFSLRDVTQTHILAPYWNYSTIVQALGRAWRSDSHVYSERLGLKPVLSIYNHAFVSSDKNVTSVDLEVYSLAERKNINIRKIMRSLKEISYDCPIVYEHNTKGLDRSELKGSAVCDYEECDYKCDGIKHKGNEETGYKYTLKNSEIDETTWRLHNYSNRIVHKLVEWIQWIFNTKFQIKLVKLVTELKRLIPPTKDMWWSTPEVVAAVIYMIENKTQVVNRWGVIQTIDQYNDFIFLIDDTGSKGDCRLQEFWATNLVIEDDKDFGVSTARFLMDIDSELLSKKCDTSKNLIETIPKLSELGQQSLLETSLLLLAKNDKDANVDKINSVNDYFKSSWKLFENPFDKKSGKNVYIHTLLIENRRNTSYGALGTTEATGLLRILDKHNDSNYEWRYAKNQEEEVFYNTQLKEIKNTQIRSLAKEYDYAGIISKNSRGIREFRIVNIKAEKEKEEEAKNKGKKIKDSSKSTGRVCSTWQKIELITFMWNMNVDLAFNSTTKQVEQFDEDEYVNLKNMTKKELLKDIKTNVDFIKIPIDGIDDASSTKLRLLYLWLMGKFTKTKLCQILEKFMTDKGIVQSS